MVVATSTIQVRPKRIDRKTQDGIWSSYWRMATRSFKKLGRRPAGRKQIKKRRFFRLCSDKKKMEGTLRRKEKLAPSPLGGSHVSGLVAEPKSGLKILSVYLIL